MDALSHQIIRGYELLECIDSGGFGAVYRAYQQAVGREVAVKVILPRYANHPDFIRRFEVEAQLVARLEHPHIVPIYDYWRDPAGAYLVMRWLPGNLRKSCQHASWSIASAARLLEQIAGALAVAHREGIIHRDIKPDNILLDEDENAYLADFGIAKDLNVENMTQNDAIAGSLAYITPEQIQGEPVTPRADIYSLGLVLYELLANESPYPDATTPGELISRHLSTPLPRLHPRLPGLPAALDEVLQTAAAKDPNQRYATVSRFAGAFRAALPNLQRAPAQPLPDPLTERELGILQLLGEGMSNPEIAAKLFLSTSTVKWYVKQIYAKLDVHSRFQSVARARQLGLLGGTIKHVHSDSQEHPVTKLPDQSSNQLFIASARINLVNPYKGLRAFEEPDAAMFFGRAALTEQLLTRLSAHDNGAQFLAVVGPSGSGKSSVVRAGLIPALRRNALPHSAKWFFTDMLPGSHPIEELEAALLRVSSGALPGLLQSLSSDRRGLVRAVKRILPGDQEVELLLVIDQFEELFTLVADEQSRLHFIDNLLSAVTDPHSRIRIVLTLRADFYDRPLIFPRLAELMRSHTEIMVPLTTSELERAIAGPAERIGLTLEPGLVATVVKDVGEQPGTLPLLQYALSELFERRDDHWLTLTAYQESGGISGALARRADALYEELDEIGKTAARQLFLRLITLGEGTEDTRRRVRQAELQTLQGSQAIDEAMTVFSQYRLLTFDHDPVTRTPTVEVAHEALIRSWGRLCGWLDTNREGLRIHRQLIMAAHEWNSADRDSSFLATGIRLVRFQDWAQSNALELNCDEVEFLQASISEHRARETAEQARRSREAQIARRAQNFSRAAAVLAIVGLLAIIATLIAIAQANTAHVQVEIAAQTLTPIPPILTGIAQQVTEGRNLNESLRLSVAANGAIEANDDPQIAILLAVRALKLGYSPQADRALMQAISLSERNRVFNGNLRGLSTTTFSPDRMQVLLAAPDNTVRLRDSMTGQELRVFKGHTDLVVSLAFSSDGKQILTGSRDTTARLWNSLTGELLYTFAEHKDTVLGVAFSSDGRQIATASADKMARLWDAASGKLLSTFNEHLDAVTSVAFTPDGKQVVTASSDTLVRLWDLSSGKLLRTFTADGQVRSLVFSSDGNFLLAARGRRAELWAVNNGQLVQSFSGHLDDISSIAFSPDGMQVLTGSYDRTARLWDAASGQVLRIFTGHIDMIVAVAFSLDSKAILTSGRDDIIRHWRLDQGKGPRAFTKHTDHIYSAAFSPDGKYALTGSNDRTVQLWEIGNGEVQRLFTGHSDSVAGVAFSPDGKYGLSAGDTTARIWDIANGQAIHVLEHAQFVYSAVFSPDGKQVVTASEDKKARLWNAETGQLLRTFAGHDGPIYSVEFSPDGKQIMTASEDKSVRLWNASTGNESMIFHYSGRIVDAAFSPDGKTIASSGAGNMAYLWDVASGRRLREFHGHTSEIKSVAFSSDGKHIVTGSRDMTARLWDLTTGQELRRFSGHTDVIAAVAFSPNGKAILTGSWDKTARVWDVDYRDFVAHVCTHLERDFSADERLRYEILDQEPTCPQFGKQATPIPPTSTPLLVANLPVWTPIASPTPILPPINDSVFVPVEAKITIDGNLRDWEGFEFTTVSRGTMLAKDAAENGSFQFALASDIDNLYIAMTMPDKHIVTGQHGTKYWNEDSFEFYLNLTGNLAAKTYSSGVFQVIVNATALDNPKPQVTSITGQNIEDVDIQVLTFKTTDGWGMEAAFPLKDLFVPKIGTRIGFQAAINGASDYHRNVKLIWSRADKDEDSWQNPSVFGHAIFVPMSKPSSGR